MTIKLYDRCCQNAMVAGLGTLSWACYDTSAVATALVFSLAE